MDAALTIPFQLPAGLRVSVPAGRASAGDHADRADAARAAEGDLDAYGRLYQRHAVGIHALARRLLGDWEADDATQDVFIRAWDKVGLYRGDASFETWLYRLAVNLIIRRASQAQRNDRRSHPLEPDAHSAAPVEIDDRLDVGTALERLAPALRHVVVLHDMEGYSHEEISGLLRIGVSASRMRLLRARQALRAFIQP